MVPVSESAKPSSPTEAAPSAAASAPSAQPSSPNRATGNPSSNSRDRKLQQRLEKAVAAVPIQQPAPSAWVTAIARDPDGSAWSVTLNDAWYQLTPEQQEAIAASLWAQKTSLPFQQLTLEDTSGKTLARNPVVGNEMVILRR